MTFSNLYDFDFIIVIGDTTWKNLGYTNRTSTVLGMVDRNFKPVDKIRLNNKYSVTGIRFTTYPGTWYDRFKPILVVEAPDGTESEIELEGDEAGYKILFEKANKLKFTPKSAEE